MASGEDLISIFKAFKENNHVEFTKVAYEIIEEEKRKNHYLLANKLENILFTNDTVCSLKGNKKNFINKQIPTDKESGFELLEIKFPKKDFNSILLNDINIEKIKRVLNEFNNKEILETYNLYPKTRILFCGPPGTGKTITAEAISNVLGIPMLYTRFDSIISSFLGETATNLRKVFDFANGGEWVLFFDEFDSIAKSRDISNEHGELKRVVNSFLQLIDNAPKNKLIIAATNYEKLIDKALWRRFDEIIFFDNPSENDIQIMIKKMFAKYHKKDFNFEENAKKLVGLSYADIERICMNTIKEMVLMKKNYLDNGIFQMCINNELDRFNLINDFIK